MTLSKHVMFLKTAICISVAALIAFIVVASKIIPYYNTLVPFATTFAALVFALVSQILIFYFFEKTQSTELRFLSIFVFSLVLELFRVMIPLSTAFNLSSSYPKIAARLLVFGRYYGVFALFAASLCASGLKNQKEENILVPIVILTLLIAMRIPVDVFTWNPDLGPNIGYTRMFTVVNYTIVIISSLTFFIAAYTRGTREYYYIGAGVFLLFLGRSLLLGADIWLSAIVGFLILGFGTWFIGFQLRRMYLWL